MAKLSREELALELLKAVIEFKVRHRKRSCSSLLKATAGRTLHYAVNPHEALADGIDKLAETMLGF